MEFFRLRCPNCWIVLATLLWCFAPVATASEFEVSFQVKSSERRLSTKHTEEQPSPKKAHPRPAFTSKVGETLLFSWKATNVGKQKTFKDVLIHCVVVKEKKVGQPTVPDLKDPLQESALTMDFKPADSATGAFLLTIDEPGAYLVRIETQNMLDKHGHEHYAAFDLICK